MSFSNNPMSQKEYLKKYLARDDVQKKKKKKLPTSKIKRSQIIDDDIDLKSMRPLDNDEVELYQMDEDAPQIAGIIDERPPELQAQEYYNSKRWKVFGGEDGINVVDTLEKNHQSVSEKLTAMSNEFSKVKENTKKDTDLTKEKTNKITSKSSDSDSDISVERNIRREIQNSKQTPSSKSKPNNSDSDLSPPRNDKASSIKQRYDSDPSPPRKHETKKYNQNGSDSDASPPRKDTKRYLTKHSDHSMPRREEKRPKHRNNTNDSSPRRDKGKRSKYKSDSDNSPPRKKKNDSYRKKNDSDSDFSQPRKRDDEKKPKSKYEVPKKGKKNYSSESDSSPHRRNRKRTASPRSNSPINPALSSKSLQSLKSYKNISPRLSRRDLLDHKNIKVRFSDSDDSPPRRRRRRSNSFHKNESASNVSPTRKQSSLKREKSKKPLYKPNDSSSSDDMRRSKSKKMKKTLDGKQAGLQDAKQLRRELSDLKMKEDVIFSKMDASVSGAGAAPIKRDRKTGQVRDLDKEKEVQKEKEAKESVVNEKYYKWGKGLKQVEDAAERAADALKEMNKPLARYANDTDLDEFLKAQEREGDPMLDYIRKKQSEATPLAGAKPLYQGSYNPNRFGIRPGHRWDGVVRSNGYEKEWFTHQNARKARNEEAYKWSTSDM